jgi:hypothetical protein
MKKLNRQSAADAQSEQEGLAERIVEVHEKYEAAREGAENLIWCDLFAREIFGKELRALLATYQRKFGTSEC